MRRASALGVFLGIMIPSIVYAEGQVSRGAVLYIQKACITCHGAGGRNASGIFPILAGQKALYLVQAIKDYQSGDRKNPVMRPLSQTLQAQDVEDLAAFLSRQK